MQEDDIAARQRYHRLHAEVHSSPTVLVDANPTHVAGYPIHTRRMVGAGDFQVTASHELLIFLLFQQLAEKESGTLLAERTLTGAKAKASPDAAVAQFITVRPEPRPYPEQQPDDRDGDHS